jgi:hypothetical protein
MSIRDRRRMGVKFISILKAAKKITNDPEFEPTTRKELTERILEEIISKKLPQARRDDPEIDWDALLEFIEKLIPIILEILSLFIAI